MPTRAEKVTAELEGVEDAQQNIPPGSRAL